MGDKSKIEWTDATWNPMIGCHKISEGCRNCYAERVTKRLGLADFRDVTLKPERLDQPNRWKRPRRIFVNSLSDLFLGEPAVDVRFVDDVITTILECPHHVFQVLTKRPLVAARYFEDLRTRASWVGRTLNSIYLNDPEYPDCPVEPLRHAWEMLMPPTNLWLGVSVEDQANAGRLDILATIPAAVRWVSLEPLIGPVGLHVMNGLEWVVTGGESGPNARPMDPAWVRQIRDWCRTFQTPFLFKQWGEWLPGEQGTGWHGTTATMKTVDGQAYFRTGKKRAGRLLDGETWDQYPMGWRSLDKP